MRVLEDMTTEEITSAVEAGKPFRDFLCRIFFVWSRGAFAWFVFSYLLYLGTNILWNLLTACCVLLVELTTNRFTIKTYSTHEVVELVMKRATVTLNRSTVWVHFGIGASLAAVGFVLRRLDVPIYFYQPLVFLGLLWIVFYVKTLDQVKSPDNGNFEFIKSGKGGHFIRVHEDMGPAIAGLRTNPGLFDRCCRLLILYPFLLLPFVILPVFFRLLGGMKTGDDKPYEAICLSIVLPLMGCVIHENWRFSLVRDCIERIRTCNQEDRE